MRRLLLTSLAAALLVALPGCGEKTDEALRAAGITPRDALGFLSVNLDPSVEQKRHLFGIARKFPDSKARDDFDATKSELLDDIVQEAGLDYERDVEPWLGSEVALTVLPDDAGRGSEPLVAVFIEVDDRDKARTALEKAKERAEAEGDEFGTYRFIDEFAVVTDTDDPTDDDQLLDRIERQAESDGRGLATSKEFNEVVDELHGDRLILGWIDTPAVMEAVGDAIPEEIGVDFAKQVGATRAFAFDLHVQSSAVVLEGVTVSTAKSKGDAAALTAGLPEATMAALTFFDLKGNLEAGLGRVGEDAASVLQDIESEIGIDLEADILSWMGGEVTVAVGAATGDQPFPPFALVVEPTDRPKAQAALEKIRTALAERGQLELEEQDLDGTRVLVVPEEIADGVQPAMGLFSDRFVVATSLDYIRELRTEAADSLGETRVYRQVVDPADNDKRFQLVVKIDDVREAIERAAGADEDDEYRTEVKPNLEPLDAFGIVFTRDDRFDRFEFKLTVS